MDEILALLSCVNEISVLRALFIYGASKTHVVRQELFDIRDKLGLDTAPEYKFLYVFLLISATLMLIVAICLLVMMFDLKVPPPKTT